MGYYADIQMMRYRRSLDRRAKAKPKSKCRVYPREFITKRQALLSAYDCSGCDGSKFLTVHHIDKDINNNTDENLVVLCWRCHAKHHPHMRRRPSWLK